MPLYILLYTGDLERIVMIYKLGFHQYADDTQICGHCNNDGANDLQLRVSDFVNEIAASVRDNPFKLNSNKTEVIKFSFHRNFENIQGY